MHDDMYAVNIKNHHSHAYMDMTVQCMHTCMHDFTWPLVLLIKDSAPSGRLLSMLCMPLTAPMVSSNIIARLSEGLGSRCRDSILSSPTPALKSVIVESVSFSSTPSMSLAYVYYNVLSLHACI